LKNFDCDIYNDGNGIPPEGIPFCNFDPDGEVINQIAYCSLLTSKSECEGANLISPVCLWRDSGADDYFQTQCIPRFIDANIGKGCLENTGCYQGCGHSPSLWKPTLRDSIMNTKSPNSIEGFDPIEIEQLKKILNEYG